MSAKDIVKTAVAAAVVNAATHPAHKQGWKTTEFWVSVAAALYAIVPALQGTLPTQYAVPIVAFITAIYTLSRSITKNGGAYLPVTPQPLAASDGDADAGEDEAPAPAPSSSDVDLEALAEVAATKALAKIASKVAN